MSPLRLIAPTAAGLAAALLPAPAAAQAYQAIELRETPTWCRQAQVPVEARDDPAAVDAAKARTVAMLDAALLAAGVPTSGVPFVATASGTATGDGTEPAAAQEGTDRPFQFDVCVAVPAQASATPAAPLSRRVLAGGAYAIRRCGDETGEDCVSRLRAALVADSGETRRRLVTERPVLLTLTAADDSDSAVADAFASGRDRATAAAISVEVTGTPADLASEAPRPLRLSSSAALAAAGLPPEGRRAAAISLAGLGNQ